MGQTETCERCGEEICRHGLCWCENNGDGRCRQCSDRRQAESDAEREAAFQRDVIGPLLGLIEEN